MRVICMLCLVGILDIAGSSIAAEPEVLKSQLRRPVALALADEGRLLLCAHRKSGSISVLDTQTMSVVNEVAAGKQLSDLALTADGQTLLVTDEADGTFLIFDRRGRQLTLREKVTVSAYPVTIELNAAGTTCYVSSLWSRRLSVLEFPPNQPARLVAMLDLPFAPREMLLVKDGAKLIVADAFGGRLGIVDTTARKLEAVRQLPAHNIRGLAVSPDGKKLLVAHQILNDLAETTHNDVHWGVLMSNVLRWLSLDRVLDPAAELLSESHVHLAGDSNTPGADPSGLAISAGGSVLVALAGDNEIGIVQEQDYSMYRLAVGQRPTTLVADAGGRRAYVANTFDDSISVIDLDPARSEPARLNREVKLGPSPELSLVDRGEVLFYDASLSSDGWFSCHSCHTDGHSNGQLNDNLGDGSFGAAKRVLSLLGVADTSPWAWNGSVTSLESQVHKSIRTTMQGREPTAEQVAALAAYMKTLAPPPSLAAARGELDSPTIIRGKEVFDRLGCAACHAAPAYTSAETFDVGLPDKVGQRKFNPPSLRGVSQRDRFFHDNRATNLEEVFTRHRHQIGADTPATDVKDLLGFLRSL